MEADNNMMVVYDITIGDDALSQIDISDLMVNSEADLLESICYACQHWRFIITSTYLQTGSLARARAVYCQ